jgi:hypothetical protein
MRIANNQCSELRENHEWIIQTWTTLDTKHRTKTTNSVTKNTNKNVWLSNISILIQMSQELRNYYVLVNLHSLIEFCLYFDDIISLKDQIFCLLDFS